jgi:predicted short-subunit dehydrogenase-like oxidoreductase (DUF2520 family)
MPHSPSSRTPARASKGSIAKRASESTIIIGPGRLGQALGRLLRRAGVPIRFVAARRLAAARHAVEFIGSGQPIRLSELGARELAQVRIVLLTVADSAIADVAADLAARGNQGALQESADWAAKIVLHTCGALPATGPDSVLVPLKRLRASVGSLHPFQTVPSPAAGVRNLAGCFWAIEGDAAALRAATKWVDLLDGTAFRVRSAQKTVYHAAAFLACPTVVSLLDHSERLLLKAGVPAAIARPMLGQFVTETVRNFVERGGRRTLTGPAVRGDWATINRHRAALRCAAPDLLPLYEALLRSMLVLAGKDGAVPRSDRKHGSGRSR